MMDSDNELIARTRAGDLSAFESLFLSGGHGEIAPSLRT